MLRRMWLVIMRVCYEEERGIGREREGEGEGENQEQREKTERIT